MKLRCKRCGEHIDWPFLPWLRVKLSRRYDPLCPRCARIWRRACYLMKKDLEEKLEAIEHFRPLPGPYGKGTVEYFERKAEEELEQEERSTSA